MDEQPASPPERSGDGDGRAPDEPLDFGPSGYLPERASKRARKIVLRAPLGVQWIVASVVAGLIVVVAGVWFLLSAGDPPGEPWVAVGPIDTLDEVTYDADLDALIVAAGGRIRAFADVPDATYCATSNRLESAEGEVWSLTGRGLGTSSLSEHPTLVQDGALYVDPSRIIPGPDPADEAPDPGCA
ncbi:MAG: hypothetical protein JJT89_11255 [Nitriliruptoraceae bacterium]|nr:hypothetical protein [Nitriliruptoraceae bacterium]